MAISLDVDVAVFGGGAAGLWLVDELRRGGFGALLVESKQLGRGQTISSQGIIHGGMKYSLRGGVSGSAQAIKDMPPLWRDCLAGHGRPDLTQTKVRSQYCYLWHTQSVASRLGMLGARSMLRVAPVAVEAADRPGVLASCQGSVYRLDEQVIDPVSFLEDLARQNHDRLVKADIDDGCRSGPFEFVGETVESIRLPLTVAGTGTQGRAGGDGELVLKPRWVVLCAGGGNAGLRSAMGLDSGAGAMQRRPLHMVMLRGSKPEGDGGLPSFQGHCTDGSKTRVTITSAVDTSGRVVWQVGGQVAEEGVSLMEGDLIRHARRELLAVLPGLDLGDVQWATYRVDRCEGATPGWTRPQRPTILREGNVITAWPTKLALVPMLARQVVASLGNGTRVSRPTRRSWKGCPSRSWPSPHGKSRFNGTTMLRTNRARGFPDRVWGVQDRTQHRDQISKRL